MEVGKLKYLDVILLDTLLAGVCKSANSGAPFTFHGAYWLYTLKSGDKDDYGCCLLWYC